MNRKGFTLIELVTVIALLGIIAIIAFVSIFQVIKKSKVSDCENLLLSIKSATNEYVSDNRYSWTDKSAKKIDAQTLIDGEYLSGPIKNPFNSNEPLTASNIEIVITLNSDYSAKDITIKNGSNAVVCSNNKW